MDEARDRSFDVAIGDEVEYVHEDDQAEWCRVVDPTFRTPLP